ncbi:MAG: polysaccharide biosynthesis/export family protein [Gammaproteobacteria bacterium]
MKVIPVILLVLSLTACMSPVRRMPALPTAANDAYRLGSGDTLQITVFAETDLSGNFRVSDGGTISMPLVGAVPAEGATLDELRQRLTTQLKANAIRDPNVTLAVVEYRPFFILGEVKNPGSYPFVPHMTVLTAVAIAGGFTFRASQDEISVTRPSTNGSLVASAKRESRIQPGDVVYVFERHL